MRWLRSLDPQLPREVWLLQLGGVMKSVGNGLVLPFLVIYLHDMRGPRRRCSASRRRVRWETRIEWRTCR